MRSTYDVIVVGLGAMGSATAAAAAGRGLSVLGLERFGPGHALGSSHGASRIIRKAYFEDPLYVPLLERAYRSWRQLEEASGAALLRITGGLSLGPPGSELAAGARRSAELHGLEWEALDAEEIERRFPAFHVPRETVGVWDPQAGVLAPEAALAAFQGAARRAGADLRFETPVAEWSAQPGGVSVRTEGGDSFAAAHLVLTAGGWLPGLVAELRLPLVAERAVQHWFRPRAPEAFTPDVFPLFVWEYGEERIWYGFPDLGEGIKVALHYQGERSDVDAVRRTVDAAEVDRMAELLRRYLPAGEGGHVRSEVCFYTVTPDRHFLIDRHPAAPGVRLVSPCSGHGFKFSPVIGELMAADLLGEEHGLDLAAFRLRPAWRAG